MLFARHSTVIHVAFRIIDSIDTRVRGVSLIPCSRVCSRVSRSEKQVEGSQAVCRDKRVKYVDRTVLRSRLNVAKLTGKLVTYSPIHRVYGCNLARTSPPPRFRGATVLFSRRNGHDKIKFYTLLKICSHNRSACYFNE